MQTTCNYYNLRRTHALLLGPQMARTKDGEGPITPMMYFKMAEYRRYKKYVRRQKLRPIRTYFITTVK
jgi:hypothetical protein